MLGKSSARRQQEDFNRVPWVGIAAMIGMAIAATFSCVHYLMHMRAL